MTLREQITVAEFWCNRRGEAVRISLREFEGIAIVDVRKHYTAKDGVLRPTKKGLSITIRRLPDLAAAIAKAEHKARELGLIKPGAAAMKAVAHIIERRVDPLDVFELRAWARAYLWAIGEYEITEAIDVLQQYAEDSGLLAEIGQIAVQQILSGAFAPYQQGQSP